MKIEKNNIYIVKENENIDIIAKKFNINPTLILIKNNILPKDIKEGFILII